MDPSEQSRQGSAINDLFKKRKKLTPQDLQLLRDNYEGWGVLSSRSDVFMFRMQVELLDAIASLDITSSHLAKIGIGVGIVGLVLAGAQVFFGVVTLLKH